MTSESAVTAETADAGVLGSLGINGPLFAAQLVNFILVALALWFLILKPLVKKLEERQKLIDDSIENSRKVGDNLQKSEQKYQERIDRAKVEANKILERAVEETEKVNATLKVKAKQEIELLVEQAKRNIAIEKDDMRALVRRESAELIAEALRKILADGLTDKKDKEFIADMLKKVS